jgi:hypothetical protein
MPNVGEVGMRYGKRNYLRTQKHLLMANHMTQNVGDNTSAQQVLTHQAVAAMMQNLHQHLLQWQRQHLLQ